MLGIEDNGMGGVVLGMVDGRLLVLDDVDGIVVLWWVGGGPLWSVCEEQIDCGWALCQGCEAGPWSGEEGRW